jgi:RNA polymerase sigma-70 factor (ECF subfamily)
VRATLVLGSPAIVPSRKPKPVNSQGLANERWFRPTWEHEGAVGVTAHELAGAPSAAGVDERDLVLRVQQGDTDAFDALVRGYIRRARGIARRLMQDPDDADDLVQDAFLRALEKIGSFDPARAFGPWFFRILVNAGNDVFRRRATRPTEPEPADITSPAPTPDRQVEGAEIRQRFEQALAELPPRQRLIVWSFEVDGMGTEEIAETLGVGQVTVRWHLHQGRRALRLALADLRG